MKNIYIHIGSLKTGTTAIQHFCSKNRELLFKHGYNYLKTEGIPKASHHRLAWALAAEYGGSIPEWYKDRCSFVKCRDEYLAEIVRGGEKDIIISSEAFCLFLLLDNPLVVIQELRDSFKNFNIKIIFYVRSPMEMAKSLYNQTLKEERVTALRTFIDWFYCLDVRWLLLCNIIPLWEKVIGKGNIRVEYYNKIGHQHINGFLNLTGLPGLCEVGETDIIKNARVDSDILERKRVSEIYSFVPESERKGYLLSVVLMDSFKWKCLHRKVDNINSSYELFHSQYFPEINYQAISVFDLISHYERITYFDYSQPLSD